MITKPTMLAVISLAVSCAHTRPRAVSVPPAQISAQVDLSDFSSFPQVSDSSRFVNGDLRAASNLASCSLGVVADTQNWSLVSTSTPSQYFRTVRLWLPPDLRSSWFTDTAGITEDSATYWGHILGSWDDAFNTPPRTDFTHFGLWIGPRESYPQAAIGGALVQQVAFSECGLTTSVGVIPVVLFHVESPSPHLGGFYVISYWRIQAGVYIQASGSGPDSIAQAKLLAALATVQVIR